MGRVGYLAVAQGLVDALRGLGGSNPPTAVVETLEGTGAFTSIGSSGGERRVGFPVARFAAVLDAAGALVATWRTMFAAAEGIAAA